VSVSGSTVKIATSSDGITWTGQTVPAFTSTLGINGITHSPTLQLWIACTTGTAGNFAIISSPDAVTWTTRVTHVGTSTQSLSVRWAPELNMFLAGYTCSSGCSSSTSITSSDGLSWTFGTTLFPGGRTASMAWNGTVWLIGGLGGGFTLAKSPDGFAFDPVAFPVVSNGFGMCWGANFNRWVILTVITGVTQPTLSSMDATSGSIISTGLFSSGGSAGGYRCAARESTPY